MKETITLTFGDCAENHTRNWRKSGLNFNDISIINKYFMERGITTDMIDLSVPGEEAYLLIVRDGCDLFVDKDTLKSEQDGITSQRDKKAYMYGRVVNKIARHNLCFSDFDQSPDYEHKKGTVISFSHLPSLRKLRESLGSILDKLRNLQCEANYYYDIEKTYIGFHGDTERRIVCAVRLGESFPIHFQWFKDGKSYGDMFSIILNHGDMYFMSEKTVGYDWKAKKTFTIRHAAGKTKKTFSLSSKHAKLIVDTI